MRGADFSWFLKAGVSALTLLLACAIATAWFGNDAQLPTATTRDGTLMTMNRYASEPIPDIVLVGSSLTFRLKEEYFATASWRNLALAGGSPLTGLAIVAHQPQLPRIVLVEANVLSRPTDATLVEQYSHSNHVHPLFFRPFRQLVAAYENWLHAPLGHEQASAALDQLLQQPPSDFDNRIYAQRALTQMNAEDPTPAVRANITEIKELIPVLEARGTRVLLFELPYSDQLEGSRSAKLTRAIVHSEFSDPDRWLHVDLPISELRWADGVHLDERSALIVSKRIENAVHAASGLSIRGIASTSSRV